MKCFILLFLLFSFVFFSELKGQNLDSEKLAIAETIQLYFDGMMERDRAKLEKAFDHVARLVGYRGENFTVTSFEDWASAVANGAPRDQSQFDNRLLEIEVKGYTALAKTELFWPGIYYYDFLTLLKVDGNWKIVHKTWYEEPRL